MRPLEDYRGGEKVTVSRVCWVKENALQQYRELSGIYDIDARTVCAFLVGVEVKKMSDESVYWIATEGPLRYIFTIQKRTPPEAGRVTLCTVQRNFKYREKSSS